jgi:hypothetical protein
MISQPAARMVFYPPVSSFEDDKQKAPLTAP